MFETTTIDSQELGKIVDAVQLDTGGVTVVVKMLDPQELGKTVEAPQLMGIIVRLLTLVPQELGKIVDGLQLEISWQSMVLVW